MRIPFLSQYLNQIEAQRAIKWERYQQKLAIEREQIQKLAYRQQWQKIVATHLLNDDSTISIRYCPPGDIPDDIEFPATLKSLTFDYSSISTLPQSICNLPQLTKLRIFDSHLRILPSEISNLSKLTSLTVRNSHLECLPESIGKLTKLSYLDLQVNRLTALPQSIANLQNLSEIDLWNNPIDDISIVARLPNLTRYCRQSLYFNTLISHVNRPIIKDIYL
jgi:Leucine-rich repeat (LRR) protein